METVDPGAGNVEEVVQNIRAMRLGSQDYCWDGGTVDKELTEVWAGRCAEVGDELSDAWNSMDILSGELHHLISSRVEGTTAG